MKANFLFLVCFIVIPWKLLPQEITIQADQLPNTVTEFEQLRNQLAITPEGGAVIFIVATQLYSINKELGKQALTIAYDMSELSKGNWYKGYEPTASQKYFINKLDSKPYIAFAYIEGSTPENAYKALQPYVFKISRNQYSGDESSGKIKVFIKTFGVMPRPITVIRNNKGIWKVKEASSIFVDVQPPKQELKEDL